MTGNKRALIADPDASARMAVSLLLTRKLGVQVMGEVGEEFQLWRVLQRQDVDILLLSANLPSDNMPELIENLKRKYPHLRLALMSVNKEDSHLAETLQVGFVYKGELAEDVLLALQPLLIQSPRVGDL